MSKFIAKTCASKLSDANETSVTMGFEISKALMTTLNTPGGQERAGFVDDSRNLPKFMVVSDLMGKRVSAWSNKPTLIRELCASFYGPSNSHFGHGSVLRHEIDNEAKLAAQSQEPTSLCLVLVSPWGESISDRFWRLMTIKRTGSNVYRDSERVLTSMQAPPARPACSVLGEQMTELCSKRVVDAFCNDWRASNLESSSDCVSDVANDSGMESRQMTVLKAVLGQLRGENARLQHALDSLKASKEDDVRNRVEKAVASQRAVFYTDIAHLNHNLDSQTKCLSIERVRADALETELKNADYDIKQSMDKIQELKCELLVQQEIASSTKQQRDDENERLKEALRQSKAEVKRIESTRKQEVKQSIVEKNVRMELEASVEDHRSTNETLNVNLQKSKDRERRFRDTASEQTARLVDVNHANGLLIKDLETRIADASFAKTHLHERYASVFYRNVLARRMSVQFRLKLKLLVDAKRSKQPTPNLTASKESQTSETFTVALDTVSAARTPYAPHKQLQPPPDVDLLHFPADAVAAANSSISMLKRFIEQANTIPLSKSQFPNNVHSGAHPQQHHQCYFNIGNHVYTEFNPQILYPQPEYALPNSMAAYDYPMTDGPCFYGHQNQTQQWNQTHRSVPVHNPLPIPHTFGGPKRRGGRS